MKEQKDLIKENKALKASLAELAYWETQLETITKDFQRINIPKLPVFTSENGIAVIKKFFGKLVNWKNIDELIPKNFKTSKVLKRTGKAGIFAGSLELVKEGNITIKQDKYFDNIYIRENK